MSADSPERVRVVTWGFVSDLPPDREDGPQRAWAIVDVRPGWSLATIPVHGLLGLLDGEQDVDLFAIPYEWQGDRLALDLGPARVLGDVVQWKAWVRRLMDAADSAAGLYEAPTARGWSGEQTVIEVDDVEVRSPHP
jgi:hypothetical protein